MTKSAAERNRANLIGSLWMVAGMAIFSFEDALVKAAAAHLPVGEVLVLFGAGGAGVFALASVVRRERLFGTDVLAPIMRLRAGFEVAARLFYVLALALTPLSATTAILQATPIVVVGGAAFLFGERAGWRRWTAIFVGLVGVLIILRPGAESFSPLSVLALAGMLGFAGRDLASRAAPRSITTAALGFHGFVAIVLAGLLYALLWERTAFVVPEGTATALLSAAIVCGVSAYAALMKAMRTGEVAAVTPFRYSRLLFGLALGVFVFDEPLDPVMVVGSLVVMASGIVILSPSATATGRKRAQPEPGVR